MGKIRRMYYGIKRHGLKDYLRYVIIETLAGDMPVVLNMNIHRPECFKVGNLASFPHDKIGIFSNNYLIHYRKNMESILTPCRDDPYHEENSIRVNGEFINMKVNE
jgi:hypothetical protein